MAVVAEQETRKTKKQQALEEMKLSLTESLMRQLISAATEREDGLQIHVRSRVFTIDHRSTPVTFKNAVPSHTKIFPDGRYGFCVDGQSYTTSPESQCAFLSWLMDANSKATKGEDYGNPTCVFLRKN